MGWTIPLISAAGAYLTTYKASKVASNYLLRGVFENFYHMSSYQIQQALSEANGPIGWMAFLLAVSAAGISCYGLKKIVK